MSFRKIVRSEEVTNVEALEILSSIGVNTEVQRSVMDYLGKFSKVASSDEARRLVNELVSRFGLVKTTAIQLVNIMPETAEELRVVLELLERREFSQEELEEMVRLMDGARK